MRSEELKVKNQESRMDTDKYLEQYLSGKAPLHANRLKLPTEEELDEAEAAFDERVGSLPEEKEQKRNVLPLYWKGIGGGLVAASVVLLIAINYNNKVVPVEEKPVVAEVVEQPVPEVPKASDYSEPTNPTKPHRTHKPHHSIPPQDEPLLAETETPAHDDIDIAAELADLKNEINELEYLYLSCNN